jgi:uncharacterized metal-binding protein
MPGARAHDMITLITAGIADGIYFATAPHSNTGLAVLFTVAYLFAGYACAGDLDLMSREYKRWGLLRFVWKPYQWLVPHRSWVSHGLLMGGILRVVYLGVVSTLLLWIGVWLVSRLGPHLDANQITRQQWQSLYGMTHAHPHETVALVSGFILAGTTHSLADIIWSGLKRRC